MDREQKRADKRRARKLKTRSAVRDERVAHLLRRGHTECAPKKDQQAIARRETADRPITRWMSAADAGKVLGCSASTVRRSQPSQITKKEAKGAKKFGDNLDPRSSLAHRLDLGARVLAKLRSENKRLASYRTKPFSRRRRQ